MVHSLTRERKREHDNEATGRATPKRAAHTERAKSRRELASSSSSRDASAKQQADNNKRNKRSFFSFSLLVLVLVLLLVVQHLEHLVLGA